jgi:hypothetical protein
MVVGQALEVEVSHQERGHLHPRREKKKPDERTLARPYRLERGRMVSIYGKL